jgi:tetratricopeptide (TPR) repeat protein
MKRVAPVRSGQTRRLPAAMAIAVAVPLLIAGWIAVRWLGNGGSSFASREAKGAPSGATAVTVPRVDDLDALDPAVAAAIRDAVAAVEREPANGARWGELGIVYNAHRYFALADRCYARAAELASEDAQWPHLRGVLAEERGDVEVAVTCYRRALERAPGDQAARYRLGNVLLQAGEIDAAHHVYAELEATSPGTPWGALGLGRVAQRRGAHGDAAHQFERALAVDPGNDQAAFLLAGAYRALGDSAAARRYADRARDGVRPAAPPDPIVDRVRAALRSLQSRVNAANQSLAAGDAAAARAIYESVLAVDPDHYDALYNLALLNGRQERFEDAQRLLEHAIEVRADSTQARLLLALALASQGRIEAASDRLRELLAIDPDHVEAKRMLAQLGS